MAGETSALQKARYEYKPKLPAVLGSGKFQVQKGEVVKPSSSADEIGKLFPNSCSMPRVQIVAGDQALSNDAMNVGVVLSGGQAPGGHNVIAGVFDAVKAANPASRVLGFLMGPKGVITGNGREISADFVAAYRNTGGFDMIGSGRDKIEKSDDIERCIQSLKNMGVKALVVIGGDDSNTNAAILAEAFLANKADIQVIGIPKTIDGDMKNQFIEASFGFDTAAKTYSELVGNICRDSMSAKKYWHFVKLMGRAASHIALEVALQTHANHTIISEEIDAHGVTLSQVVEQVAQTVAKRAAVGKDYGVVVIPEGLLEFLPDFKALLKEMGEILRAEEEVINQFPDNDSRTEFMSSKLSAESSKVYSSLPESIQETLLRRDKHGNVPVSQVNTEALLVDLVKRRLVEMKYQGFYKGTFSALQHFFGYEGRCVAPSNFDADYTYSLGYAAVQLIRAGLTGYTVSATNLVAPAEQWQLGGIPITSMLNMESRKGKMKPVIRKALVELEGGPFKFLAAQRDSWVVEDNYVFPGPVQYFGPAEICDVRTKTIQLEHP